MKGSTIIKGLIILLGVVFVGNQLVSSIYSPIKTESADFYVATDGFEVDGFVIRTETPITTDQSGVMHYAVADGSRVAKNGVIADIYSTRQESINAARARDLTAKIRDLEEILSYNAMDATNLELLNTNVNNAVDHLVQSVAANNYDGVYSGSEDLLSAINHRQAAMGQSEGFEGQLAALKTELASISLNPISNVKANESGYFVSTIDGYEQAFKDVELSSITPEFMESVTPAASESNVIGKIVSDYEWYIAATVTLNDSLSFKEGDSVKILTALKSASMLSAKVKTINLSGSSSSAVIIFSCSEMSSEMAALRTAPMTVVKSQYEGLKVSKKSLRFIEDEDGNQQQGVYVVIGMQMDFVPVKILYFGEDFVICEKQTSNEQRVLKLYDNVIVKGRNLYDGKIIG